MPTTKPGFEHRAYARYGVQTAVRLAALPASKPGQSALLHVWMAPPSARDVLNSSHWLHEWRNPDGSVPLQLALLAQSSAYLLRIPELCDFHIDSDAGTILIHQHCDLDPYTLEHLLIDQVLPRLLAQRGHLIVHASQVQVGTGSILFMGQSGWGKSTLAGLLHQLGHPALCDDCVLLELHDGRLLATPSYPGLRLYLDSIEQIHPLVDRLSPVSDYSDKQRVIGLELPSEALEPQPVAAIYVLTSPDLADDVFRIQPLSPASACMALIGHSFRLDPTAKEQTVQTLTQAAQATHASPVFSLNFPRDFDRRDTLVDFLLNHFYSLASPTL